MAPLTAQERSQIVEGGGALGSFLATELSGAAITGPTFLPALAFLPPVLGLLASINRPRFPRLSPADILSTVSESIRLRERGLEPVVSTDPFTGNVALSTQDQANLLPQLLFEAAARDVPRPSTDQASALREILIEGLAETAESRGFFPTVESVQDLRGGVFRATADSPLQFINTGVP